jgi:N-acetylmuramoyl-L-alanine amidase
MHNGRTLVRKKPYFNYEDNFIKGGEYTMNDGSKFLIALDDGHGMNTAGKRTPVFPEGGFMKENEFNSRVVELLNEELKRCGFRTLLTAPTDEDTSLYRRVKRANDANVDLFLSVHANAFKGVWGDWGGITTFAYVSDEQSKKYGQIIHRWLLKGTEMRDRGVKDGSWLYVIRKTKKNIPAFLVECGFMDNLREARLLKSEAYRKECAVELAKAMCEIFNVEYVEEDKTSKLYKVQVGAFRVKENALKLAKELRDKGYNVYIAEEDIDENK